MKVFYVEDEGIMAGTVKSILKSQGHQISYASNLSDATRHLKDAPYDLYLLDAEFPRNPCEDEPELLVPTLIRLIREHQRDARIVVNSHCEGYRAGTENLGAEFKPKTSIDWLLELQ